MLNLLGMFTMLWKATIRFIMSVYLYVCLSTCIDEFSQFVFLKCV
jgi:hypothetical protein